MWLTPGPNNVMLKASGANFGFRLRELGPAADAWPAIPRWPLRSA